MKFLQNIHLSKRKIIFQGKDEMTQKMALSSTHKICWEEEVHVNKFGFCCSQKLWHEVKNSIFVQEAISWQFWKETIFNSPPLIRIHSDLILQENMLWKSRKTRHPHFYFRACFFIFVTSYHYNSRLSTRYQRNKNWRLQIKDFHFRSLITFHKSLGTNSKLRWYLLNLFWK